MELQTLTKAAAADSLIDQANALQVTTDQQYSYADAVISEIIRLEKELEAEYKSHPAYIAGEQLREAKGKIAESLNSAKKSAKAKKIAYEDAQEAIRKAEQARMDAEARKVAEDQALRAAVAAEQAGEREEAEAILAEPVAVPVLVAPKTTPKTHNVARTIWEARIINPQAVPRMYCIPDEKALGALARATKGAIRVEGVEFVSRRV